MVGQPRNITHTSVVTTRRSCFARSRCFGAASEYGDVLSPSLPVSTVVKHSSGKLLGNPGHVLALESTHLELKCRGHAQFAPRPGYATRAVRRAT